MTNPFEQFVAATTGRNLTKPAYVAISIGVAIGSSVCGRIIDDLGPRWGYGFAASCGLITVMICLVGLRRLRATPDSEAEQWADA